METSEKPKDVTPLDAASDAMMVAYSKQVTSLVQQFEKQGPDKDFLNALLETSTNRNCHYASVRAIYFLTKKYSDLFETTLILGTSVFNDGDPIKERGHPNHKYFLALGTDSYWYAGSPANHDSKKPKSYAMELFRDKSLNDILVNIHARDGGRWPSEEDILKEINNPKHKMTRIIDEDTIETTLIEMGRLGTVTNTKKFEVLI